MTFSPEMRQPQPMQPVVKDKGGVLRFRENAIVRYLLDLARQHKIADLNSLAELPFSQEDREQFTQLIGYAITGYHELSYVSDESCAEASVRAKQVLPGAGGCRDAGCPVHGGPLFDDEGRRLT
jgi:hypothetical protein